MLSRRWILGLMVASAIFSGVRTTVVRAAAGGGNTKPFMSRQAAKQREKERKEKEQKEQKEKKEGEEQESTQ